MKKFAIAVIPMIVVLIACDTIVPEHDHPELEHDHPIQEHRHQEFFDIDEAIDENNLATDLMREIVNATAAGDKTARPYVGYHARVRAPVIRIEPLGRTVIYLETGNRRVNFKIYHPDPIKDVMEMYEAGETYTFLVIIEQINNGVITAKYIP